MGYADHVAENERLALLRFLAEADDHAANTSIIQSALRDKGIGVSRDTIHAHAAWLEEQHLVMVEEYSPTITIVHLTQRGGEVARGTVKHPGVKRPEPRFRG